MMDLEVWRRIGVFLRIPRMPDRPHCRSGSAPALPVSRMWPDHVTARKKAPGCFGFPSAPLFALPQSGAGIRLGR
jgi:hypothetical protein